MDQQTIVNEVVSEFKTVFPNVPVPPINWNPRMRTTAGRVRMDIKLRQGKWIELNPHLLQDETSLRQTLMHELCHVADFVIYGKIGHGPTWKKCMRLTGRQPNRCHQYDTSSLKRRHKRYPVKCNCRTYEITAQRLRNIQFLSCRSCKGKLTPMSQNETEEVYKLVANGLKF